MKRFILPRRIVGAAFRVIDALVGRLPFGDPVTTSSQWLRRPQALADRDVCILVAWSPTDDLPEHAQMLAEGWHRAGFAVILVIASDVFSPAELPSSLMFCEGVLLRANEGYDFGAWASVILSLPELRLARLLVTTNDSVFGPLNGLPAMIEAARAHSAELVGAVGSTEHLPHLQSFLLFFKRSALNSRAFQAFWRRVRNGNRAQAIRRYELPLAAFFLSRGVSVAALHPADDPGSGNPTLSDWRRLIKCGFPFVKTQLLRENPFGVDLTGWRGTMRAHGFDPAVVDRYLARHR